jgi:anaerobic selenocysteine-containing dehydrogenase
MASNEFYLIGRRNLRSNNSWMHNFGEIKGRHPCFLMMHEADAMRMGLAEGQSVRVESAVGRVEVPVHMSRHIMPGVVSLPHGWGHRKTGSLLRQAFEKGGTNLNELTDARQIDKFSGNAALNGQRVQIRPVEIL